MGLGKDVASVENKKVDICEAFAEELVTQDV